MRHALKEIVGALAALGKRTGPRAEHARSWLEKKRAELGDALAAFESVGMNCDGPAARKIIERLTVVRAEVEAASRAFSHAETSEAVRACRDAHDYAAAKECAVYRALASLAEASKFPVVPDLDALAAAKEGTEDLAQRIRRSKTPATTMHAALEQGAGATAEIARLWICFEPKGESEVFAARYARFEEGHDEFPAEREREMAEAKAAAREREAEAEAARQAEALANMPPAPVSQLDRSRAAKRAGFDDEHVLAKALAADATLLQRLVEKDPMFAHALHAIAGLAPSYAAAE